MKSGGGQVCKKTQASVMIRGWQLLVEPLWIFFHSKRPGGSNNPKQKTIKSRGVQPDWGTPRHEFNKVQQLFWGFNPVDPTRCCPQGIINQTNIWSSGDSLIHCGHFRKKIRAHSASIPHWPKVDGHHAAADMLTTIPMERAQVPWVELPGCRV